MNFHGVKKLSTTYETELGDTFETVSRKTYGHEGEASRIAQANPGVTEPLQIGVDLTTPVVYKSPKNITQASPSAEENETAIMVKGTRFRFWSSVKIMQAVDTISTVEMEAPFDPDAEGFLDFFEPFAFSDLEVTVGGGLLFTGNVIGVTPKVTVERKTISLSGYSVPGVLGDCTSPDTAFPLEFVGVGLSAIADTLVAPFGITVDFRVDQGPVFEQVAYKPGTTIWSFLTGLAKQRNVVMSSSPEGNLIFWQSVPTGSPVATFAKGNVGIASVTPHFNPQDYYSSITGITPMLFGEAGTPYPAKNSFLKGVLRPMTYQVGDVDEVNAATAVEAKRSRMFANMVSYTVEIPTWRDPNNNLWTPNTTISLHYPDALILKPYEFVIRSVKLERSKNKEMAKLNLVLPGSFSGEPPETLPWLP